MRGSKLELQRAAYAERSANFCHYMAGKPGQEPELKAHFSRQEKVYRAKADDCRAFAAVMLRKGL